MESIPDKDTPILVVDDDTHFLLTVSAILASSGLPDPALVSDSRRVMKLIREHHFQLVLLDLLMPHISGMDILRQIKEKFPEIECVIVTAIDKVSAAVDAMKLGAFDYLVKPFEKEKLLITTNRALERYYLHNVVSLRERVPSFSDLKNPQAFKNMVAADEAMAQVFSQAEAVAPTNHSVLITGESGTGKEMLARIIHTLSYRSQGNFVAVNMAAFSRTLFEDEFFGHIKGAFTDARTERMGFLELAQGGTIFLDEITELDSELQGKLLRVMEEGELYRLGSSKMRIVDVRFITSSNRNINEELKNSRFRKDLFYRLNTFHLHLPPLRERKKDILPLARYFLNMFAKESQKRINSIDPKLAEHILEYPFPGNVRELKNIIASAVLLEERNVLTLSSAKELINFFESSPGQKDELLPLAEMEKQYIYRVLETTGKNRSRAAKILGMGLRTLQRKLKSYEESTDT